MHSGIVMLASLSPSHNLAYTRIIIASFELPFFIFFLAFISLLLFLMRESEQMRQLYQQTGSLPCCTCVPLPSPNKQRSYNSYTLLTIVRVNISPFVSFTKSIREVRFFLFQYRYLLVQPATPKICLDILWL